jgi:hypothetical protein
LPVNVTSSAVMMVEDVPLATRALDSADNLMPTIVPGEGGIGLGGSNSTSMLWVTAPALATIVAVPKTPSSLIKGTSALPPPVLAVVDFAPPLVKRPSAVVKVTNTPSGTGTPVEVINAAVMVVELMPLATRLSFAVDRVSPAISVGGGVGGGVKANDICILCVSPATVATTVAVPITLGSLIRGTTAVPVPSLVTARIVFKPVVVKRPRSVVKVTTVPSGAGAPLKVTNNASRVVELEPLARRDAVGSAVRLMLTILPGGGGGGGAGEVSGAKVICRLWLRFPTLATTVAVPTTPGSLMNGTTAVPVPWLVGAEKVFSPPVVKRPRSVVKVTTVPSGAGAPVEVKTDAVMVVELAPSALRTVSAAASVRPTTGPGGGGGGAGRINEIWRLWVRLCTCATMVAVPPIPASLMNGTVTMPLP